MDALTMMLGICLMVSESESLVVIILSKVVGLMLMNYVWKKDDREETRPSVSRK